MNILFLIFNNNQWNICRPIIEYIRENVPSIRPIVLQMTNYYGENGQSKDISVHLDKLRIERINLQRRTNVLIWKCNIFERWRILSTEISWQLDKSMRLWKPTLIVLFNDCVEIAKMVIWKAKRLDVPTLLIQDGILFPKSPLWVLLVSFRLAYVKRALKEILNKIFTALRYPCFLQSYYGHGGCDKILVFGHYYKDMFIKESLSDNQVIVTGSPKYEMLLRRYKCLRSNRSAEVEIRKVLKIAQKVIIVTYFSTNIYTFAKRYEIFQFMDIKDISRALTELGSKYILLVKVHPKEAVRDYVRFCRQNNLKNVKIVKNHDNLEIIYISSVIITVFSTMMLEAMLFKKPVLLTCYNRRVLNQRRSQIFKMEKIENVSDIVPMISRLLYDREYANKVLMSEAEFLKDRVENVNSQESTRRVVSCILSVARDAS